MTNSRRIATAAAVFLYVGFAAPAVAQAEWPQGGSVIPPNWLPPQPREIPIEYDRPYEGKLLIVELDEETLQTVCRVDRVLGCARPPGWDGPNDPPAGTCAIAIAKAEILARFGKTVEQVKRHEIAHCNGWLHEIAAGDLARSRPRSGPSLYHLTKEAQVVDVPTPKPRPSIKVAKAAPSQVAARGPYVPGLLCLPMTILSLGSLRC